MTIDNALAELQEEQARIAQELEDTFVAYDKKLQAMARRLSGLDREPVTDRELRKVREEQLELWRLVRRAQAGSRTTGELKRELQEWSMRESGAVGYGHPDHPGTRVELVASELRVRGVEPGGRGRAEGREGYEGCARDAGGEAHRLNDSEKAFGSWHLGRRPQMRDAECLSNVPVQNNEEATSLMIESGPGWEHDDDEALLRELRSRRGEMERIMKNDEDEESVRELATFLSELRELHAHLRLHDRRNGIERERWRMGMPVIE